MGVLALHMENDHTYEFNCTECEAKFPFKNQLKLHRREVHKEGTFSCFVCNDKFKTHKLLKAHIQKKCKSQRSNQLQNKIVHKRNDDILPEDEHKCPQCPKITNNQVSLINHMNTAHKSTSCKCDTCGGIYVNRELLIKHIVDNHTDVGRKQLQGGLEQQFQGGPGLQNVWQQQHGVGQQHHNSNQVIMLERLKCQNCDYETNTNTEFEFHNETVHWQQIRSHYCKRCNTKYRGSTTRENHMCRLPNDDPQNTCNFCKIKFTSKESKIDHICQQHHYKTVEQQKIDRRRANTKCKNGVDCWRASRNKCWFMHTVQVNQFPHQEQGQVEGEVLTGRQKAQGQDGRPKLYCQYQERCFKGVSCTYLHINQDFLQRNPILVNQ